MDIIVIAVFAIWFLALTAATIELIRIEADKRKSAKLSEKKRDQGNNQRAPVGDEGQPSDPQ